MKKLDSKEHTLRVPAHGVCKQHSVVFSQEGVFPGQEGHMSGIHQVMSVDYVCTLSCLQTVFFFVWLYPKVSLLTNLSQMPFTGMEKWAMSENSYR